MKSFVGLLALAVLASAHPKLVSFSGNSFFGSSFSFSLSFDICALCVRECELLRKMLRVFHVGDSLTVHHCLILEGPGTLRRKIVLGSYSG